MARPPDPDRKRQKRQTHSDQFEGRALQKPSHTRWRSIHRALRRTPCPAAARLSRGAPAAAAMRLIVTPDSARRRRRANTPALGVTLYGLRSDPQLGLRRFPRSARSDRLGRPRAARGFHRAQSAARHSQSPAVQHQPLPAEQHLLPQFPVSRCRRRAGLRPHTHQFETPKRCAALARLRASPIVEYEQVAALKRRALELIFEAQSAGPDCEEWIAGEGDLLRLYATYCALDEHLHAENPDLWVWPDWPAEYRDPDSDAVARVRRGT